MKGDYGSMIWLNDKDGTEYVCYLEDVKNFNEVEGLSEEARKRCVNVNEFIGTERW